MPAVSRRIFIAEIIILILLLGGIGFLSWQLIPADTKTALLHPLGLSVSPKPLAPNVTPLSPSPSPSAPVLNLPSGPQTYTFSFGKDVKGPHIQKLTVNPLTPAKDSGQTIELQAKYDQPITSVTVELITDSSTQVQKLSLKSGTNLNGTWSGFWQIRDTYDRRYGLHLILNSTQTYDNIMWFRQGS